MVELARLAEIKKRFEELGLTPEWMDRYMENRALYSIYPEKAMTENGEMIMLPPGTLPDYLFFEALQSIIKNMEIARQNAIKAQKLVFCPVAANPNVQGNSAAQQSNWDLYQQHMRSFYLFQNDLHIHVTKYKPIAAKEFFEEVNRLIDERLQILSMQYTAENISYTAKKLSFGGILPPNQ
jgi:hypothetical protein